MQPRVLNAGNAGPFTLDGTRTFLVGRERVAVVDPGPDLDLHLRALLRALESASEVSVVVTHWHQDHAGLAERLAEAVGKVPVHGPGSRAGTPLPEGSSVETDEGALTAVSTPGHARHHVVLYHADSGAVFAGDLLLGRGDTTWIGEYPESVREYLASLDRVRELAPAVIYPAHGPPIMDPLSALDRFEAHRRDRIAQVAAALRRAPDADLDQLLRVIYGDVPEGLGEAARLSIESMVHYLRS